MDKVWLLLGPELGLKKQKINVLISKAQSLVPESEELETIKCFASDDDVSTIAKEIQTPSLFASNRAVHIEQVDFWSASVAQTIVAAIKSKDKNTLVLLCTDETKVSANLEKIVPKSNVIKFWNLSEKEYTIYIRQKALELQMSVSDDAIEELLHLVGDTTIELDTILQQIAVFNAIMQKEKAEAQARVQQEENILQKTTNPVFVIGREQIETWLSYNKQETTFKIIELIAQNKYEAAFLVLESLLRANSAASQLIGGMVYQIKNSLRLVQAKQAGLYINEMFRSLKIFSDKHQRVYLDFVAQKPEKVFQTMLELCVLTEQELRNGGDTQYQELQMYILLYRISMLHRNSKYLPFTKKSNSLYNINNIYLYDW